MHDHLERAVESRRRSGVRGSPRLFSRARGPVDGGRCERLDAAAAFEALVEEARHAGRSRHAGLGPQAAGGRLERGARDDGDFGDEDVEAVTFGGYGHGARARETLVAIVRARPFALGPVVDLLIREGSRQLALGLLVDIGPAASAGAEKLLRDLIAAEDVDDDVRSAAAAAALRSLGARAD